MLSERGVWVGYDRILRDLQDTEARSYLVDLRDMALAAAQAGIKVEPKNSDTDRPEATT